MKGNLSNLVNKFLTKNTIYVDKAELQLQIQSHPSYPSLHAITGVLDHFNVENLALDLPKNKEVYEQLPNCFLAHLNKDDQESFTLVNKKNTRVQLTDINNKKSSVSIEEFLKIWTGVLVAVEKEEVSVSKPINNSSLKLISILGVLGILTFLVINNSYLTFYSTMMLLLTIVGVYISSLLVKHELGLNSQMVEKLCTASKNTNCDSVLNSKGAKIFKQIKLSDVSMVYFISLSIILIIHLITNISLNTLALLSISITPIILYSVFYQAFIVKKWCPLCLSIAGVLSLQVAISFFMNRNFFVFNSNSIAVISLVYFSVIGLYAFVKPLISKKITLSKKEIEYYKFKRNFSIFETLHKKNNAIETKIDSTTELIFGNKNATTELLVVTNPLCSFCKATHQAVENLLKTNNNSLKIIIRFNININDKTDISYKIASILVNIYKKDSTICRKAMHTIYSENVDIKKWLDTYKKYLATDTFKILETQKQWCINNSINFTPATYLNQRAYPNAYDLTDLSLFLEELETENVKIKEPSFNEV